MEEKLKIQQVSCSLAGGAHDKPACVYLDVIGFESKTKEYWESIGMSYFDTTNIGAVPKKGKEFFIYYTEPEKPDDKNCWGKFRLVRKEGELEELIDEGAASESHFHEGLKTKTFYGIGEKVRSWSFHCKIENKNY